MALGFCASIGRLSAALMLLNCVWLNIFSKVAGDGSVGFWEGRPGQYLRSPSNLQEASYSILDISAAASILLGSAPPSPVGKESAAKLNELLSPNPFNRPHVVLMMSAKGLKIDEADKFQKFNLESSSNSAFLFPEGVRTEILNYFSKGGKTLSAGDVGKQLKNLCTFLGGAYQTEGEALVVTFPLGSGDTATYDLSKTADRSFVQELAYIYETLMHEASGHNLNTQSSSKMLAVSFSGIEGLRMAYGDDKISAQASELLLSLATKLFSGLYSAFDGHLVGILVVPDDNDIFSVSERRAQLLEAGLSSNSTTIIAEALGEKFIAYLTGVILLVALIIGSCFLFKMPITRDTLLYSGAKLD